MDPTFSDRLIFCGRRARGCWDVFLCTRKPLALPTVGYAAGMTVATRYDEMGEGAGPNPSGAIQRYAIPYSVGVVREIVTLDKARSFRALIRNSQLAAQSLRDIWK